VAVAFLQKCCYKWLPRKCLGLDVTNFIIFISKKKKKDPEISRKKFSFFEKNIHQVAKFGHKKN
jgi:hypothetical protein